MYYVYSSRVRVLSTKLSLVLSSLSLSSSQTTTETRKESTPQQQTAKRSTFFEDHHREGKELELLKNSLLFFSEKNSKITRHNTKKCREAANSSY